MDRVAPQHKELAQGRWFTMPLCEQMANVGSEIERTIKWRNKGNDEYSRMAFFRALELLDLTIADPRHRGRLKEICRTREALADKFYFDNTYKSTDESWRKYFLQFTIAARMGRRK